MNMNMKRNRDDIMANCLMLISRVGETSTSTFHDRVFECKTCNRKFHSFQALGGHRASHKRAKLMQVVDPPHSPKTHQCSICGVQFGIGQALGGHMRRHRAEINEHKFINSHNVPVLKRSNSKRVLSLDLDLNLTPYENDLKLGYQIAPLFSRFI